MRGTAEVSRGILVSAEHSLSITALDCTRYVADCTNIVHETSCSTPSKSCILTMFGPLKEPVIIPFIILLLYYLLPDRQEVHT